MFAVHWCYNSSHYILHFLICSQQYGVLSADGSSTTSELGYQTISVLPAELNQEGMNYVLVMTPQDGDDKQAVAQLVDLKVCNQRLTAKL